MTFRRGLHAKKCLHNVVFMYSILSFKSAYFNAENGIESHIYITSGAVVIFDRVILRSHSVTLSIPSLSVTLWSSWPGK